ncbi:MULTISPECIES: DUF2786 domain-containing protein [Nocardia]|uniref:DUF2786 domain-containing protein n=1 Tax=Nocardia TaxID=1817 RepID=UPI0024574619|nr:MULTISPECIES: DUF2786 domain-containing protein [Nocardia]
MTNNNTNNTTTATRADMLDKVRKLLAQAENVAGTPEADVFNAKAFELIAKYGIDETAAREQSGRGPAPIEMVEFLITGQYQTQQAALLHVLAKALHCAPLSDGRIPGRNNQLVYGTTGHIERLRVLFATLMPQMLAGAARVRPHQGARVGTKAYRTSWMRGFAATVDERLTAAENNAATESEPGTALVLVNDSKRAVAAMHDEFGGQIKKTVSRVRHDNAAAAAGAAAARRVNLGQTGLNGRRALG